MIRLVALGIAGLALFLLSRPAQAGAISADPKMQPSPGEGEPMTVYSPDRLTSAQRAVADKIVAAAEYAGMNPAFMLALAVTESSLHPSVQGDDGISLGLFQLTVKRAAAFQPGITPDELLDADTNIGLALNLMSDTMQRYPEGNYGDLAQAWTLGPANQPPGYGYFTLGRRNPAKLAVMSQAISDLALDLDLNEVPV